MTPRPAVAVALLAALALPALAQTLPLPGSTDERPFPGIAFKVVVDERKDGATGDIVRILRAVGTTEYPPGTTLVMEARLKGAGGFLNKKHATGVTDRGQFEAVIDDLGRNVYKGLYEVRVSFDPEAQAHSVLMHLDVTKFKDSLHSESVDVRLGTPEEEAAEKADADQSYARSYAQAKGLMARTLEEYAKQMKEPKKLAWGDFMNDILDSPGGFTDGDHKLAEFARSRDNVRDQAVYDHLNRVYALSTSRLFALLSAALGIEGGKGTKEEKDVAQQMLDDIQRSMGILEGALGGVKIDPGWKPPKKLEPLKGVDEGPAVKLDPSSPIGPPPTSGTPPIGTKTLPQSKFGVRELGIGFAIMCAIAMAILVLKRR